MTAESEFDLIPTPAKVLATLGFFCMLAVFSWAFNASYSAVLGILVGVMAGGFAAAYILLVGYVYADAARRGMPPILWTALALLIPNCVGIVLYFLMRKPILRPCPTCGGGVTPDASFCSQCGRPQSDQPPAFPAGGAHFPA